MFLPGLVIYLVSLTIVRSHCFWAQIDSRLNFSSLYVMYWLQTIGFRKKDLNEFFCCLLLLSFFKHYSLIVPLIFLLSIKLKVCSKIWIFLLHNLMNIMTLFFKCVGAIWMSQNLLCVVLYFVCHLFCANIFIAEIFVGKTFVCDLLIGFYWYSQQFF